MHKSPPIHQITETDPTVSFTLSGQQQQRRAHKKKKKKPVVDTTRSRRQRQQEKGEGTGTRANGGAALVDPAKGSPAAPPEFRIPRGPPHDAAAACPGLPLLFYVLTLSWMDVEGKESIPGKIWSKSAGDLAFFHALGFSWSSHAPLSPFSPGRSLFLRSLSLISPGILSCAACLVCSVV